MQIKKVRVINIGCKTNYHDSHTIESQFKKLGVDVIDSTSPLEEFEADLFIINTCTVTKKADKDCFSIARRLKKYFPNSKTLFTGCLAQLAPQRKLETKYIDYIIGNSKKFEIPKLLDTYTDPVVDEAWDLNLKKASFTPVLGRTRAFLRIQDGCEQKCSFCTIHIARGPERSLKISDVIEDLKHLTKQSYKEVHLTGIRIGNFGKSNNETLYELLEEIEQNRLIQLRYRLGSLYPNEIDANLISLLKESKKFCPHFHISQQSIDNKVLAGMNRSYKAELFASIVTMICKSFSNPFIGVDIIAGFPGETDEQFENTYTSLKNLPISDIHAFSFSPRPGTPASNMLDQVSHDIKKDRVNKLIKLAEMKKNEFWKNSIGTIQKLLVEKPSHKTEYLKGYTENYLPVRIAFNENMINTIVPVAIKEYDNKCLYGEPLSCE